MRVMTSLVVLLGSTLAAAQSAEPQPPAPSPEPAPPPEPPPAPAPAQTAPPTALPPITITITNNNTGNNSNTNTQTSTAPVTVSTPVTTSEPVTISAPPAAAPPAAAVAPVAPVAPVLTAPGLVERVTVFDRRQRSRWVTLGLLGGHDHDGGVRASIDLLARGRLRFGIAASASGGPRDRDDASGADARHGGGVVAYVAVTRKLGRLDLRAQIGLGFGHDERDDRDAPPMPDGLARTMTGTETSDGAHDHPDPRIEAALLVGLPLGRSGRFGLVAGPVISATRPHDDGPRLTAGDRVRDDRHPEHGFLLGLRYGF